MDYTYNTSYNSTSTDSEALAAIGIAYLIFSIVLLIYYVFASVCLSRIFKKAGVTSWYAWVPVLNTWKFLEMGNQNGALSLLAFVPFVNLAFSIFQLIASYRISEKFGKDPMLYLILYLLANPAWLVLLAFGDATWNNPQKKIDNQESKPVLT